MPIEICLPSLGEGIHSGDVLSILVKEGDQIVADQGVIELETDKATIEVPSPQGGRIVKIFAVEGKSVAVGAPILTIEPTGSPAPAAAPHPAPVAPVAAAAPVVPVAPVTPVPPTPVVEVIAPPPAPPAPVEIPGDGQGAAAAGPAIRRMARELGVDLRRVRGSGEGGRITKEDVQAYVREANQRETSSRAAVGPTPPGNLSTDAFGTVRREKMSRLRQTIARNMTESYTTIPQLTNFDDADVTELEKIRQESKDDYARDGIKLTTMAFLTKAVAASLRKHPVLNASVDMAEQQTIYKEYVNIGVAVDTDRGLLVPVIRDADRLSIPEIARQLQTLAERARLGQLGIDEMRGGTFTISNLGSVGGVYSTPIVNPPEVAILLVGRTRRLPVYVGETLEGRLMMPLSISYDHRVVDGAAAARFLDEVKKFLSAPGRLLLAP